MEISISSSSPSPVSDYIHAPDFALNIYCHHMAELKFLWFISFFAFFTFLRVRFFFKLWQNPSAVLCQISTTNTLTGGTSTFTPLLFWSLGVSCRHLAEEHMWDFLKWKLHDEGKHLKWKLRSESRQSLEIVMLALLLLLSYPTYRHPNQLCYCARTSL